MSEIRRLFPAKVQDLLCEPQQWTQGVWARDYQGNPCLGDLFCAECWCLMEAIICCYATREYTLVLQTVYEAIGQRNIDEWQDHPERTFAEIRALIERLDI